ncbi:MAG: DUF4340 domain-containing protein [Thermosynechococcaceae cyanobacterium]
MKSNTLILVMIALLFGGGVFFFDRQQQAQKSETEAATATPLFSFSEDDVQRLRITTPAQTLVFQRATSGPSTWSLGASLTSPADEAAVLFLVNLLATAQRDRILEASAQQFKEFGLEPPTATVVVTLKNQKSHTLVIGGKDFNQRKVYALVDPPPAATEKNAVTLVPTTFLDAIARPLSEWKYSPPESLTPSPTPIPTPSP